MRFADAPGLRPTTDRIRETLFNWLQPYVPGARCLDLFAGSGALGLEALSRGAGEVVFVEKNRHVTAVLRQQLEVLQAAEARVIEADALGYLEKPPPRPFDIVFLDPPFHKGLLAECILRLEQHRWLAPGAYVYLEAEKTAGVPAVPDNWRVVRSKHAGQVGYHLALREGQ